MWNSLTWVIKQALAKDPVFESPQKILTKTS